MSPELFIHLGLDPALALLPKEMDSVRARAFVIAICLQESKLEHRRQGGGGPARSYAQFERAGILGVLTHEQSQAHASAICALLDVKPLVSNIYTAIEFNDVLAAAFTRLLIWTLPQALPRRDEHQAAWTQYLEAWRPGKPRPQSWSEYYAQAWDLVQPVFNGEGEHSS